MLSLLFSCLILALLAGLAALAPYHLYRLALEEGLENDYIKIDKVSRNFIEAAPYDLSKTAGVYSEELDLWQQFHFSNFEIPFPLRHPFFTLIPHLEYKKNSDDILGAKFFDPRQDELAKFQIGERFKFKIPVNNQKIYTLPIFKNKLIAKEQKDLWKDLFLLNLYLPKKGKKNILSFLTEDIWPIPYHQLIYQLFILEMRVKMFPKNMKKIYFHQEKNLGVLELESSEKKSRRELYLFPKNGIISTLSLVTNRYRLESEALRKRFISKLLVKESQEDSSIPIAAAYKLLGYDRQVDHEGMVYLYSSFSHIIKNDEKSKSYLKRMIQFLERGERTLNYLTPLYEYTYKRFGSTFSLEDEKLKETAPEKLERGIQESLDKELEKAKKEAAASQEGKFENKEAQINYYLEKAKSEGEPEDKRKSLIID